MRTLLIPPAFLGAYAAILLGVTWLIAPGDIPGSGTVCYPTNMAEAPRLLLETREPNNPGHSADTEIMLEELAF